MRGCLAVIGYEAMAFALTPRIGCVILAAGAGRRFGGDKLLAPLRGKPLLQHAVDAACGAQALTCTLVLGAGCEAVLAAVDPRRARAVFNAAWSEGLASSLRCGLRHHRDDDACIVLLGDQPFATSADLDQLIAVWSVQTQSTGGRERSTVPIVALRAGDVWGAPVLFPRRDFAALRRSHGDAGAKRYAEGQKPRLLFAHAAQANAFEDVDTRADLSRLNGRETRRIRS